jgi:tryptophan-specific transport protein
MLLGSSLCFVIYLLWLVATMGNLDQAGFVSIIEQGGNIGELVNAINLAANVDNLGGILSIFANLAIVSSFLGVSLSMFDFIADRFSFADDAIGRLKTALVTFVPPTIGGLIFPHGFITAIGFAGLVVALNALIIPPMMVIKSRQLFPDSQYTKTDGNKMAYLIMVLGVLYAICHVLNMLSFLPVLGGSVGH